MPIEAAMFRKPRQGGNRFSALCLLCLFLALPARAQVGVPDDAGNTVRLAQPAHRIVSLAPHATEMLYAIGAGDRVVGVVSYSDYPPAARRLPRVGSYRGLDLEAILALRPDLVVAWQSGNPPDQLAQLRQLGIPLFLSEPRRLPDIPDDMERLGVLAGVPGPARAAAERWRADYAALVRRYAGRPPVRVFYEVWNRPLMTVNDRQIIGDVLHLCGGRNVFGKLQALTPTVSIEAVLAADPEAIIAAGSGGKRPAWLNDWLAWPRLAAVARHNLFVVDADLVNRPGPRLLEGARQVCAALDQAREHRAGR